MNLLVTLRSALSLVVVASFVNAVPINEKRGGTTGAVTNEPNLGQYATVAQYANEAYCPHSVGDQVNDATITFVTGDGRDVQRSYVAYSPTDGIIVSVQGTNTSSIDSIENDITIERVDPDSRLAFLGDVSVNDGFQSAWLDSADATLSAVQDLLSQYPDAQIISTGHSLGAAISLYNSVYITHQTGVQVVSTTFGLPRAGNVAWANAFDNTIQDHRRITNYRDPIPHLPGSEYLGYQHPSNEIWITAAGTDQAVDCAGQENEQCAWSVEPDQYEESNHDGPYAGVKMNSC